METQETRDKLANAIKDLQSKGDTASIDSLVGAYKAKYQTPKAPTVKGGLVGEIFTGNTQRFGKTIGESIAAPENADKYAESLKSHTDIQSKLIKAINDKKKLGQDTTKLMDALTSHTQSTPKLEDFTGEVINKTGGQIAGEALGTGVEMLSVGALKGVKGLGLARGLGKTAQEANVAREAYKASTPLQKLGTVAKDTALNVAQTAPLGYGLDVSQNLQEGKTGAEAFKPGLGTALSIAIPGGIGVAKGLGIGLKAAAPKSASLLINSLVKPLLKDFSYGKNPGRAVAEEGIIANNLDELADKIKISKEKVGEEIGAINQSLEAKRPKTQTLKLSDSLKHIDEEIKNAKQAPRTNNALINRLEDVRKDLLGVQTLPDGTEIATRNLDNASFGEAFDLKRIVGDITKWTGNASDDKVVNKTLKRIYGDIKTKMNATADLISPQEGARLKKLNEKYADLTSAEIATKYRDKIEARQDVLSLKSHLGAATAVISAIASGGATVPVILAGLGGAMADKVLGSTAFKTRVAAWLAGASKPMVQTLLEKNPAIRNALYKLIQKENLVVDDAVREYIKNPKIGLSIEEVGKNQPPSLTKGAIPKIAENVNKPTALNKIATELKQTGSEKPDIKLKRDVQVTTLSGEKVTIPEDEVLTAYEKGGKTLLKDGREYIVSKNQYENIKNNSIKNEAKDFAPELKGTEETIMGSKSGKIGEVVSGKDIIGTRPPKYSQYQLPDGKNYKEILIKAPRSKDFSPKKASEITKKAFADFDAGKITKAERDRLLESTNKYTDDSRFQSSHWDEKGVISHLRINERTYKGKKVAFIEELQSDWAREGRSKGFQTTELPKGTKEFKNGDVYSIKLPDEDFQFNGKTREEAIANMMKERNRDAIPNNPLLKNWTELSIKRALKDAVDSDAEYFAWINGEQTSARYNLAKQVDKVVWGKNSYTEMKEISIRPNQGGYIELKVEPNGNVYSSSNGDFKGKKLDEVLGKGLADKVMSGEKGSLSGEGLKFGGEWANNLYDKQVGNIVSDLTGAKVEKLDMGLPIEKKVNSEGFRIPGEGYRGSALMMDKPEVYQKLKVGMEISGNDAKDWIVTDILGNGEFKAVEKNVLTDSVYFEPQSKGGARIERDYENMQEALDKLPENYKKTFNIFPKKTIQQGIKITPEIRAKIRGEAPILKKSSETSLYAPTALNKKKLEDKPKKLK
jgi:hypothetical protein